MRSVAGQGEFMILAKLLDQGLLTGLVDLENRLHELRLCCFCRAQSRKT
ncbi:hypothetical protein RLDS_21390 [Sphingobium lactosutens DS20]|uniref:Uncharacterized protein n=1 Tax=Sphingobium lactosutens DS20 TaxID=1331060 RepID=T0HF98_9SPHN|nr:hypothetical protein RLDS_21390 [Sphingobium lactosutens DS20]